MPIAVAPALRGHGIFSSTARGRSRAASEAGPPPPLPQEIKQERRPLPKAASYTYFPRVKDLDQVASEQDGDAATAKNGDATSGSSSGGSSPSEEEPPQMLQMRPSAASRRSSRFLPFSSKSREPSAERKQDRKAELSRADAAKPADAAGGSPARSMTKLRRKSWVVSQHSRPASPTKEKAAQTKDDAKKSSMDGEASKRKTPASIPEESVARTPAQQTPDAQQQAPLSKKNKRLSGLITNSSALPAFHKSFSTDQLPLYPQTSTQTPLSPSHVPPLPRNISTEKLKGIKTEPRKKDELWSVFRTLDADLRKFQSKSMALKANVVRTALLPFLRNYASHPSNHKLRPEDLDRRANILNGWWTGLLELVAGRNNQSISGTDRPTILEGLAGIMERSEWRLSPSPFCALADRVETSPTKPAASSTSINSDFLAESVIHNVRNIFTQNLLSQMTFVVDKMSPRNAPASLVTFCGKTCAYAFMFCPGIADILVRLWNPSMEMMKRVLQESGVSKLDSLDTVSEQVVAAFPPTLLPLKFQSLGKLVRTLRVPASFPLGTANLDWYGLWLKRWSGEESDLFYVFVKHYHILVSDFLPAEPSDTERMCVPGLVAVHAQVLVNLDATINRHATPQHSNDAGSGPAAITFDDVLGEPDASASAIAMPPANATRQMQENRFIMLMRDFLSERNSHLHTARRMFANSIAHLLQAQTRKVSIYDSNACYTLCDLLEEAFTIMIRYEQLDSGHHSILNWPFWLSVCRKMAASESTSTEIKLYAFLYSIWSAMAVDEQRKASLCLDFILEPVFFESRFNHWCPMVRSYFMRLLCWRVARFDGEETEVEVTIKKALSDRLRSVWSHYLWLQEESERKSVVFPSTQACNPAPGRRFLIIRNDNPVLANNGPFLSFDGVMQNTHQRKPSATTQPIPEPEPRPVSVISTDSQDFPEEEPGKGKWNMLKSLIGAGPKQSSKSKSAPSAKEKENAKAPATNGTKPSESASAEKHAPAEAPAPAPSNHRIYSFRFSLEWVDKRFGAYQNMRLQPPRLPLPAQVLLQQKGINIDTVSSSQPTGTTARSSQYAGRALAEWTFVSHECQNFFDRRKNEGVPLHKLVETPTLNVEVFRRPG
ncbi:DUF1765-domain-containing protein [Dothidotthia symphoricarpi CBS 119687]|uniref:DUF1765-domain-containing protein n=1 Tax=Dothidotthia symphoricarpi CBS 119687 TaxID=1392245 RepID=A0A6A6ASK5_9PLEO|nr:DUF1765-domain-containing protein [Dothidotthia symphoricarpi CBS 119687]KAF2133521.1 DUF1765-domain-containing protein [Dothidotthia symphoricarpi CBS 119687]